MRSQELQAESSAELHVLTCAVALPAGAPRTKAGGTNVFLIIFAVILGIAFVGAGAFAAYQYRVLKAVKHDNLHNGYISLNPVGRDSA